MIQGGHRGTPHPDLVRKSGFFKAIVDGALLIAAVKSGGASAWMGGIFCGEGPGASAAEVVTGKEHQKPTEFFLDEFFVWAGLSPRERQILLDAVQYIKAIFHIHNISKMFPPAVVKKANPKTLKEVKLKETIQGYGMNLAGEGEYFGWKPLFVSKSSSEFTKEQLLARGWTKDRLLEVAEKYELIHELTTGHGNPSALGRAKQLREIVSRFF